MAITVKDLMTDNRIQKAVLELCSALEAADGRLTRIDIKLPEREAYVGSLYGVNLYEDRS